MEIYSMLLAHTLTALAGVISAPASVAELPAAHSAPKVCSPQPGRDLGCKHDRLFGVTSHTTYNHPTNGKAANTNANTVLRACHPEPSKNRGCMRAVNISETKTVERATVVAENDAR
jgi:hypothetical protein